MKNSVLCPFAVHMSGGNFLDDLRIDLNASFRVQDDYLAGIHKQTIMRKRLFSMIDRATVVMLQRLGIHENLVMCGLKGDWFREFADYWTQCLRGRPLSVFDFHNLKFDYRKRMHRIKYMNWDSPHVHIENYQRPENLFCLFDLVLEGARNPVRSPLLFKYLSNGCKVLEFGCALAPMYRTWRRFLSHVPCNWVLADLPNYPFHMARHLYGGDKQAHFHTIESEHLDEPLDGVVGNFDVIILQEVFEHLHKPLEIARYLINRIKPCGYLLFDYIRSDATGHDTPAGLNERLATLDYLGTVLTIVEGQFNVSDESLGLCVGVRK